MHRPVLQQRQDRGAHIAAARPAPATAATTSATTERTTEGRTERPEGPAPPLEVAAALVTGPAVTGSRPVMTMLMSM
ncbi:hypothetical protein OG214_32525 [Streptomyces sp. NBC_00872]|nr:hypothetical protein OG214_32525 [Streptomyces sp. NBC_00872]